MPRAGTAHSRYLSRWRRRRVRAIRFMTEPRSIARFESKPIERMRAETEEVGVFANGREDRLAEQLDGDVAREQAQVELHRLDEPRQVVDDQHPLALMAPNIGQDRQVGWVQELDVAAAEDRVSLADRD